MSQTSNQQEATISEQQQKADLLDQLLKPEVQESLTVLVDNLPKLTEMVTFLTKAYDVTQSLVSDPVFVEDVKAGMGGVIGPVVGKAKGLASAAIEAGDRAQVDTTPVGLFGLLKMIKDPNVQQTLRFGQAYLNILSERQNKQ